MDATSHITTNLVKAAHRQGLRKVNADAVAGVEDRLHVEPPWVWRGHKIVFDTSAGTGRMGRTSPVHVGSILGAADADGDAVTIFVKPGTPSDFAGPVFVAAVGGDAGTFEENVVMVGFPDKQAAVQVLHPRREAPLAVTAMSPDTFDRWLESDLSAPAADWAKP